MKLDHETYFKINESFKDNIFNKVIAYADDNYDNIEELMILRSAVESYLASIGIDNLEFSHVEHERNGYNCNKIHIISLIYHSPNSNESNTVYNVHVSKGLYITTITATVSTGEETLGSLKTTCITQKTYMLDHDLDCNIDSIEVEKE